ncbi:MAG: hypothetical protein ACI87T_001689, partial [Planctomycetota bacterium]
MQLKQRLPDKSSHDLQSNHEISVGRRRDDPTCKQNAV